MIRFSSLFALAALLAACMNEKGTVSDASDEKVLSFVFEGIGMGAVTYAIATEPENQVDNMDIYMFEYDATGGGAFHRKWNTDDPDCILTQTDMTTQTLMLSGAEAYGTTEKVFYFVANPAPTTDLDATGLTEAQFRESLTLAQVVTSNNAALLTTPLLFTGNTGAVDPLGTTSTAVTMKRRVARFDIVNNYEDNFVIERIFVSAATIQGYAFGNALGTGSPVLPTARLAQITEIPDYVTEDNDNISPGVFYLYPTTVSGTSNTQITIQARVNGEASNLFYLDPATDMPIGANHRYKLVIHEDITHGSFRFTLEYADWDEGGGADVNTTDDDLEFTLLALYPDDPAGWDEDTRTYILNRGTAWYLNFLIGSAAEITCTSTVISGNPADVTTMPVFTSFVYATTYSATITHACEVIFPVVPDDVMEELVIRMRIQNAAQPSAYVDIFFVKEPTIHMQLYMLTGTTTRYAVPQDTYGQYGFNLFCFEDSPEAVGLTDKTVYITPQEAYNSFTSPNYINTGRSNKYEGLSVVMTTAEPNAAYMDYNTAGSSYSIDNVEMELVSDENQPGLYKPLVGGEYLIWNMATYAQGAPFSVPEPMLVSTNNIATNNRCAASVTINLDRLDQLYDPANPGTPVDPTRLWVIFEEQVRALELSTGEQCRDIRGGSPLLVDMAVTDFTYDSATFRSTAVFGTFGTYLNTDPDYAVPVITLMYGDVELLKSELTALRTVNQGDDYTFTINPMVSSISISAVIGGWAQTIIQNVTW